MIQMELWKKKKHYLLKRKGNAKVKGMDYSHIPNARDVKAGS